MRLTAKQIQRMDPDYSVHRAHGSPRVCDTMKPLISDWDIENKVKWVLKWIKEMAIV